MKIITSLDNVDFQTNATGIALGNFDGIHMGHKTLIIKLVEICKKHNIPSVIYTFRNHPKSLTSNNRGPLKIVSDRQKLQLLRELGVDYTLFIEFDEKQRMLAPEKFIEEILVQRLNMQHAVVGYDYRFGYKAKGDIHLLEHMKAQYNYQLQVIQPVAIENEIISSTVIRQLIQGGQISKANLYLGKPFSITGTVIHGRGMGKQLGFPTANIELDDSFVLPSPGVYYTKTILDQKIYYSATNVGHNPTFGEHPISIETHLLDFDDMIYGKKIEVLFLYRARREIRFSSKDELIGQMARDLEGTREYFLGPIL